jgi:hypothetical protein
MDTQILEERIKNAEAELAAAREELNQQKNQPWEPKGGEWIVYGDGEVLEDQSDDEYREFGCEFQTKEAAEQAVEFFRLYHRLYHLALECNGGFISNEAEVYWSRTNETWAWTVGNGGYAYLFTVKGAEKASKILNRDNIQPLKPCK